MGNSKKNEINYRDARKERLQKEQKNAKNRTPKGVRKKKRIKALIWALVCLVIALIITGTILVKTGFVQRRITAFEVSGEKFTIADYNYWYQMIATQVLNSTYSYPDRETVMNNIYSIIGVAKAALAEGKDLSEEEIKTFNATAETLRQDCKNFNGSERSFYNKSYGMATNEEIVLRNYRYQLIAIKYYNDFCDKLDYKDADLEKYFKEHGKETLSMITFRACIFTPDQQNTFGIAYPSAADALTAANKLNAKITDEKSFVEAVKDEAKALGVDMSKFKDEDTLEEDFKYSSMNEKLSQVRDWLFSDDRKANDHTVITENIDGNEISYLIFVVEPLHREDYNTVDMRHILISTNEEGSSLSADEFDKQAKTKIEKICAEWEETDMTDKKFEELVKKYSEDSTTKDKGGLIEKITKEQLVESIDEFLFEDGRKAGDYKIVKSTYGYHLVYYKGANTEKWKIDAKSYLTEKDFETESKRLCDEHNIVIERNNHLIDLFATEKLDETSLYQ